MTMNYLETNMALKLNIRRKSEEQIVLVDAIMKLEATRESLLTVKSSRKEREAPRDRGLWHSDEELGWVIKCLKQLESTQYPQPPDFIHEREVEE